jgi:superkiller protein 3
LLKGDNILSLHNLGFCYETKKDYPRALTFYKRAVEIDPRFKDAYLRIGVVQEEMTEYDQALRSLKKAVEIDPDFLDAQFQMGCLLTRVGMVSDGLKKFELVMKADPSGPLGKKATEKINEMKGDKFRGIPKVTLEKKKP